MLWVGEPPVWQAAPARGGVADSAALDLVVVDFAGAEAGLDAGFGLAVANLSRDAEARLEGVRRWRRTHPQVAWLALVGEEPMVSEELMLRAGVEEILFEDEVARGLGRAVRRALARAEARPVARPLDWESLPLKATRLTSLGTVAAGVAHEINNPLAYIRSNLEYIREEFSGIEERFARLVKRFPNVAASATGFPNLTEQLAELRTAMDEANEGVTRVTDVVGGLKHFSSRPQTRVAELCPAEVARSSLRIASRTVSDRAHFETRLGPVPAVRGSEAYLGQVVLNLLVNAAQAIPEDAADDAAYRVSLATYRACDGHAVIEVSDTGPGMSAEVSEKIFEPFFTTKPDGTGLGLAVSRQVVEAFGGELTVESELGAGSTFRVKLPPA